MIHHADGTMPFNVALDGFRAALFTDNLPPLPGRIAARPEALIRVPRGRQAGSTVRLVAPDGLRHRAVQPPHELEEHLTPVEGWVQRRQMKLIFTGRSACTPSPYGPQAAVVVRTGRFSFCVVFVRGDAAARPQARERGFEVGLEVITAMAARQHRREG